MTASTLFKHTQLLFSKLGHRLFRHNVGVAYQGETIRMKNGDILIKNPRTIRFGLVEGMGDGVGWTRRQVTPNMLGKYVLIFTTAEIKYGKDRLSSKQLSIHNFINDNGGISYIIKSISDADSLIK